MHEKEHQTGQRSSPQSSPVLMSRCHAKKVWSRKHTRWLTKRIRLTRKQALNKVRKVRYRLDIRQKKVGQEKHLLGDLLNVQKEVNDRMCRRISENIATASACAMPTDEITASQGWIGLNECAQALQLRIRHFCHRRKASCDRSALAVSRGRKTCREGRCMWNEMILLLILALALIPGVGEQFRSQPSRVWSSSIHKPSSSTQTSS